MVSVVESTNEGESLRILKENNELLKENNQLLKEIKDMIRKLVINTS